MMKKFLILVVLLMSITAASGNDMNDILAKRIDAVFEPVYNNPNEPGAAVIVFQGKETIYSRCFGLADLETRTPVTLETNFCIASVSKQFSAVALLQLAEEGKLSLNDPLSKFFPEFQAPFFKDITLHHILSHTSGIPDARPRDDRNFVLYSTDVNSVQYMRTLDHLNFQPGTQYEYINPTFQLIYQIVERVSGMPFETYMQKNIFDRIGMKTCCYFERDRKIANMAHGYQRDANGLWQEYDYGEESFFATKADGALYCSITDFVRWERALRDNRVWTAGSKRLRATATASSFRIIPASLPTFITWATTAVSPSMPAKSPSVTSSSSSSRPVPTSTAWAWSTRSITSWVTPSNPPRPRSS